MLLTTRFNLGDQVWVVHYPRHGALPIPFQATVGAIEVNETDSPGIGETIFDNYKAKQHRTEKYQCVETGIGTGAMYYFEDTTSWASPQSIFATYEECEAACWTLIAKRREQEKQEAVCSQAIRR